MSSPKAHAKGSLSHSDSEQLLKLYKDPKFGLLSKSKFVDKAKASFPHLTKKSIGEFVANQELQQITEKQKFKGYYKIVAPPHSFQMDIFFMDKYKRTNQYSSFLLFVDILSRKMFVHPLKDRKITSILSGIKELTGDLKMTNVYSDDEFNKKEVISYFQNRGVNFSSIVSKEEHISKGNRLGIIDTATRTIKRMINKYLLSENTTRYINVLDDLVENYNSTEHVGLGGETPDSVFEDEKKQQQIYEKANKHNAQLQKSIDLDVGDYVRKSTDKGKFEKEKQSFSREIYNIYDTDGYKYILIDFDGKVLERRYKYSELLKIDPTKTKVKPLNEILDLHYGKKTTKPTEKPYDAVAEANKDYKKAKKVLRKLRAEGIDAEKVYIKKSRKTLIPHKKEAVGIDSHLDTFED
jgi:hypothetical protein